MLVKHGQQAVSLLIREPLLFERPCQLPGCKDHSYDSGQLLEIVYHEGKYQAGCRWLMHSDDTDPFSLRLSPL
ncbi:hypothetical protein N836_25720 [Leptolyngbya sp. Heron Island J]|nr:hypothetical protein N836_25720 [Leptolyngbya sp. Heron Island J]